jgi:hypothetical protein
MRSVRRSLTGAFVVGALVLSVAAPVAAKTTPTTKPKTTTTKKPKCCTVGDTATSSDFKFKVWGFTDPQPSPNQFAKPAAGSHFVSVDVEVFNPSTKNISFSGLLGFHLLDGKNRQYDEDIVSVLLSPKAPEGQIPPKGSIRGLVGFQVPDGSTGLKLRVQGSITASGATFKLS